MIRILTRLILLALIAWPVGTWAKAMHPKPAPPRILVNQVGYLPHLPKRALFTGDPSGPKEAKAILVDSETQTPMLKITPGRPYREKNRATPLRILDFSALKKEGRYHITWQGIRSLDFHIGHEIYTDALTLLLRSYTLQRCGVALEDPLTGLRHGPCHLQDALVAREDPFAPMGTRVDARGGWHDAGDFGKYVATTAITAGRLLAAWEKAPTPLKALSLSLPHHDRASPTCDLLTETRVGLLWMLRMQRSDGALYRKLSGSSWPSPISPDEDSQTRYLYGISSPETAKAAAAFAMAARVYKASDPVFSRQCLSAARKAWEFLVANPEMLIDHQPGDDSGSGPYLYSPVDREATLTTDLDDRFWAAAELFITTRETPFLKEVERILPMLPWGLYEWKDPSALGMANLLHHQKKATRLTARLKKKLILRADTLILHVKKCPWFTANPRLIWGSNKMIAEEGITLALAYEQTGNPVYLSAASAQLNFLLGINPFGISFVTGLGEHSVRHSNHLFARALGKSIPGLLVGGANASAEDGIAPKGKGLRSYVDDPRSYATNEYAIDYNASLIGLIVHLTATSPGRVP
ncbi:glycoside hydrolase family 9 protein [Desulfoluna sp.]|uniref:glycoside hydrolase family 9 protein n=1 Tax=Desulfoluna sp. TaxID=2045199 RepID=UPI00263450CB|nr:glycoside hydrolase family 9 protein [Desulfoluna sp.]